MSIQGKNARPIIIVKRKKKGTAEHHGGAWKVAYADFVTAMMAFFLVMWLVTAVSKEQRAAIFEYFKNPSMESGKSVKAAPGQMGPGGASTSPINLGGGLDALRSRVSKVTDIGATAALVRRDEIPDATKKNKTREQTEAEAREQVRDAEHKKLETLMVELKEAVSKSQALEPFKDQLLLDITPEGIRIQIVDAQNRPMFDIGSARLRDYTQAILRELAPYLTSVPNRISITGHTDIRPYPGQGGYSNWELSADRANAARRALVSAGLPDEKIARVVGLASSVLFNRADPQNAINRRISIVIMTKQAEEDALKTDVAKATPDPPSITDIANPSVAPTSITDIPNATPAPPSITDIPTATRAPTSITDIPNATPAPPSITDIPTATRAPTSITDIPNATPAPPSITDIPTATRAPTSNMTARPAIDGPRTRTSGAAAPSPTTPAGATS